MQLTTQMIAEINEIHTRLCHVFDKFVKPSIEIFNRNLHVIIAELSPCKVRLENILCETDIKEQAHSH